MTSKQENRPKKNFQPLHQQDVKLDFWGKVLIFGIFRIKSVYRIFYLPISISLNIFELLLCEILRQLLMVHPGQVMFHILTFVSTYKILYEPDIPFRAMVVAMNVLH